MQSSFNLVTWTGPDGTAVIDAITGFADVLNTLFVWGVVRRVSFASTVPCRPR